MITIYGKFPILLPGLTQSISRNGLKFTNGTIAYLSDQPAAAIQLAKDYGDLFPPPSTRNTGLGFWELSFQAVEFTPQTSKVKGVEIVNLSKSFSDYIILEQWELSTITLFQSADTDDTVKIPTSLKVESLTRSMKSRRVIGNRPATSAASLAITWTTEIRSVTRRNFGNLDEVDLVVGLAATIA